MPHNIFVQSLLAVIIAIPVVSCVPKVDIDSPAGHCISVGPSGNSNMTLQIVCNSDVKDYIRVMFHYRDHQGIHTRGEFSKDTLEISWPANVGQIQIAFRAVSLRNTVLPNLFTRKNGVTFNVAATLRTPTDGVSVNWAGLKQTAISNSNEFWHRTANAVNNGIVGQPLGTGTTRYLNFMIREDEYGPYGISVDWKPGNLFENDE